MRLFSTLAFGLMLSSAANAGGRGGHNTTFDPNSYGGGWTCFRSQASNTCGAGSFIQYLDAACDGVTADNTALAAWVAYGIAHNPALQKLYIPPGSNCTQVTFSGGLIWNQDVSSLSINNAIIWAYGASVDTTRLGGSTYAEDTNCATICAKIQTASAGDSSVVLVSGGDASKFSVGDWITVSGLAIQTGGVPPAWQFFDHRLITNISGSTITLNQSITNDYKSTWPQPDDAYTGGPAGIYKFQPSWNTNLQVYGLTIRGAGTQACMTGRDIAIYDMVMANSSSLCYSVVKNAFIAYTYMGGVEADKEVETVNIFNSSGSTLAYQSASVTNTIMSGVSLVSLGGTGNNMNITNSILPQIRIGPTQNGHGVALNLDGVTVHNPTLSFNGATVSGLTFSSGVLNILTSSKFVSWGVPGMSYYWGDSDGSNDGVPLYTFKISDMSQDGTKTYFTLSNCSWGSCASLPTAPTCNVSPCPQFVAYQAQTIKQLNSPVGSSDLTQFAAPP